MPLVLDADAPEQARLLAAHRARLEAQTWRLQRRMHRLAQLIEGRSRS